MGAFDDLIPSGSTASGGGAFDDLIPPAGAKPPTPTAGAARLGSSQLEPGEVPVGTVAAPGSNAAAAAPLRPIARVKDRGMILPLSTYDDGTTRFDPDAGIAQPVTAFFRALGNIDSSKLPSEQPELIPDTLTVGMGAPVDFKRPMIMGGPQPGTVGWQSRYGSVSEGTTPTVGSATAINTAQQRSESAARDLAAMEAENIRPFGPAFNQGPVASVAKQLSDTPLIGAPVRNALEESITDTQRAAVRAADAYGTAQTPEQAGANIRLGLERFRDARPTEIVEREAAGYNPAQISEIIAAPTRDTSLKTKQAALYERAWSFIPEEMRQGRAVQGRPRVVGDMPNARAVLQEIQGRNNRMLVGDNNPASRPIGGGGMVGGMIDAMMNERWRASLQTMRDMRSDFRRLASGMADTEKNTLRLSDIERVQSAITQDMIGLLQRNQQRYAQMGDVDTAQNIGRSINAFRRADNFTRLSMQRMDYIEKMFNAPSAEALYRNVFNAAKSKGKGDLDKLRILRRTLRPEEMGDIASSVIRQLGEPTGSTRGFTEELGFSVGSFMTNWNNMQPEARNLLFGPEHRAALDNVVRAANRLANVEALANTSRSFSNAAGVGGIGALGAAYGTGTLPSVIGAGLALGGVSVLMSTPTYARWLGRYIQLREQALRARVPMTAPLANHILRLEAMAKTDPALRPVAHAVAVDNGVEPVEPKEENGKPRDVIRSP